MRVIDAKTLVLHGISVRIQWDRSQGLKCARNAGFCRKSFKNYVFLIRAIQSSLKKKWFKALIFDYIIHILHIYLLKNKNPDISFLFLNADVVTIKDETSKENL